jgi:hypothetical protein
MKFYDNFAKGTKLDSSNMEYYAERLLKTFDECKLDSVDPEILKWTEILGNFFELGSPCLRDIGSIFMFVESILQDPTNITFDIYFTLLSYYAAFRAKKDCGAWI